MTDASRPPRNDVGRYRKLFPRIWRHPGFSVLTKTGRELALYALTGPQVSRIGLFYFSVGTAAEDLNVGGETLRKGLADVCVTFGWHFDPDARVFYIPSWWKWNPPENENVLKGNLKDLNDIPPCALVEAFARNLETLPETFHQTFTECCRIRLVKRSPNQEHYQDQDQKQKHEQRDRRAPRAATNDDRVERLLPIAREAVKMTHPNAKMDERIDHVQYLSRERKQGEISRADAIQAINLALSESRQVTA